MSGFVGGSDFFLLLKSTINPTPRAAARTTKMGTPSPIPTLAPVESPLLLGLLGVGAAMLDEVDTGGSDAGWVVDDDDKSVA
jgi:hypothetical protein